MALKEKIIERAQKYILKGYLDKALAEYKSAADFDPRDISIRLRIGDLYVKTNRKDEAIKEYTEAARANAQRGFYLKSIAVYKQVLKIDDTILDIHYKLAELYTKQRLIADAIGAYSHIVSIFEKKEKTNEVMELLKKMLDIDPDNVGVRLKLAELYQKLSFDKDALEEYSLIFNKLMEKGKLDRAEKVFLSVYNTRPAEPMVLKGLAELYKRKGDETKFLNYAKPLLNIFRENGDTGSARVLGQAILDMRPDDPDAMNFMRSFAEPAVSPPPVPEEEEEAPEEEEERLEASGEESVEVEAEGPSFEEALETAPVEVEEPVAEPLEEQSVADVTEAPVPEEIAPEEKPQVEPEPELEPEPSETLQEEEEDIDVVLEGFDEGGTVMEASSEETEETGEFVDIEESYGVYEQEAMQPVTEEAVPEEETTVAAEAGQIHEETEPVSAGPVVAPEEEEEIEIDLDLGEDALDVSAAPEQRAEVVAPVEPTVEAVPQAEAAGEEVSGEPAPPAPVEEPAVEEEDRLEVEAEPLAETFEEIAVEEPVSEEATGTATVEEAVPLEAVAAEEAVEEPAPVEEPPVEEAEPETIETVEEVVAEAGFAVDEAETVLEAVEPEESIVEAVEAGMPAEEAEPRPEEMVEEAGQTGPEIELPEAELEEGVSLDHAAESIDSAGVEEELSSAIEDLREKIESDGDLLDTDKVGIEEPAPESETEYIDLSAELGMEETLEEIAGTWSSGESGTDESLDEFKEGIGTQLSKEDCETHYNLGIAYMEMELYDEAIKEFRVALRDPRLAGDCYARLGLCAMAESRPDEAIGYYLKELKVEGKTESERKGIMYELALAYEAAGETDEAVQLFKSIYSTDPDYREVAEKLADFESERPYIPLDDGLIEVEFL